VATKLLTTELLLSLIDRDAFAAIPIERAALSQVKIQSV
jgi:hypothetical protein